MLSKIHKRSADYAAFLLELSKSLECRAKAKIKEARKHSLKDLGRGVTVNFAMALSTLVTFTYFIWEFDHIHRLYDSVVMNLLVAWFPIAAFYEGIHQKDNDRRFSLQYAGIAALSVSILVLAFSNRHEFHELGINVVLIMASFPWLFIFWKLVRRKRVLAIGMTPSAIMLMGYWVVPALSEGLELYYSLVPLPVVSILLAAWTLLVWLLFKGVDKLTTHPKPPAHSKHAAHQKHSTLGPLMESLAMLFLFIPTIILAILVTRTIPGGEDWSAVTTVIVGFVLGSVVSDPFTCFLRNFGNLPSACKNYGGDKS